MSVAIYTRVSSRSQEDHFSLPQQRKLGIKFAENLNEDYIIYEDVGTGTNLEKPEFQRLLVTVQLF